MDRGRVDKTNQKKQQNDFHYLILWAVVVRSHGDRGHVHELKVFARAVREFLVGLGDAQADRGLLLVAQSGVGQRVVAQLLEHQEHGEAREQDVFDLGLHSVKAVGRDRGPKAMQQLRWRKLQIDFTTCHPD